MSSTSRITIGQGDRSAFEENDETRRAERISIADYPGRGGTGSRFRGAKGKMRSELFRRSFGKSPSPSTWTSPSAIGNGYSSRP